MGRYGGCGVHGDVKAGNEALSGGEQVVKMASLDSFVSCLVCKSGGIEADKQIAYTFYFGLPSGGGGDQQMVGC